MLNAVLFDLDGTLLPLDQDEFTKAYFGSLSAALAPHGYDPDLLVKNIWKGTAAMVSNDGLRTNEEAFWQSFCAAYGEDARRDEPIFARYYENEFQKVREICGYAPQSADIIKKLKNCGVSAVLATNPLFPAVATESRIRWAGLEPSDFLLYTTYENSHYCKPNPKYYREICEKLSLDPSQCLMVGNDAREDTVAAALGMKVFLLTDCLILHDGDNVSGIPSGSFSELVDYIDKLLL